MPEKTSTGPRTSLPSIVTGLAPDEIVARLRRESQQGRLPGFETKRGLFQIEADGRPFPSDCIAEADTTPAPQAPDVPPERVSPTTTLRFERRLQPLMPWILAITLLVTIEPGRYFTDQFIPGAWNWIPTAWWYYPLTILPAPFIWRSAIRKSRRSGDDDARRMIETLAPKIEGRLTD